MRPVTAERPFKMNNTEFRSRRNYAKLLNKIHTGTNVLEIIEN